MSQSSPPPAFSEILDRLRGGADPDQLQHAAERLQQRQRQMQDLIRKRSVGHSETGQLTVECDPSYRVHEVKVDGSLTVRPSARQLEEEFRAAWTSASDAAQARFRDDLKSEFGITIPTEQQDLVTAATEGRQNAMAALQPALDSPLFGDLVREMVGRAEEFGAKEFEGADGVVRVRVNAIGMLTDVVIDAVEVRDLDNLTLGEQLTAACQQATDRQQEAQRSLTEVPYREELDVERYQTLLADMQTKIGTLLRNS